MAHCTLTQKLEWRCCLGCVVRPRAVTPGNRELAAVVVDGHEPETQSLGDSSSRTLISAFDWLGGSGGSFLRPYSCSKKKRLEPWLCRNGLALGAEFVAVCTFLNWSWFWREGPPWVVVRRQPGLAGVEAANRSDNALLRKGRHPSGQPSPLLDATIEISSFFPFAP